MAPSNRKTKPKTPRKSSTYYPASDKTSLDRPKSRLLSPAKKARDRQSTPVAASSKQDKVLEMLRAPVGTTIAAITKATVTGSNIRCAASLQARCAKSSS
jgi:hypothetical protein